MRKILITCWISLSSGYAFSQGEDNEIDLQLFVEEIFQLQEDDLQYEDLYESLLLLYTSPLNLNEASRDDLYSLYILNEDQIDALIEHRQSSGKLLSIYELQAIEGYDLPTIRKILPFVTVAEGRSDTRNLLQRIIEEKNKFLIVRVERTLEKEQGFTPPDTTSSGDLSSRYEGGRNKVYSRFRVSRSKDFSLGFTLEKDEGEAFGFDRDINRYGADFSSFHIVLENQGRWKSIALGDYQIQLGQGLILGAGFNPGKGSETITTIRRASTGIRPYSSVLESGFFRGAAATYSVGRFDLTGFYSNQLQDANVQQDTTFTEFDEFISSIQATGFHRTPTELQNKDQVREQIVGSNLMYRSRQDKLQVGVTFVNTNYDVPLFRTPNNYNQFEFQGDLNYTFGLYSNYRWQNINFFGEAAMSESGGIGGIGGLIASFSRRVSLSLVLRNYQRDFHSFYGNAFGESSRNINESGIYWGLKFEPIRTVQITGYYDRFRFPWLRFRAEAPSDGHEYLIRITHRPTKTLSVYGQFRQESKERNSGLEGNLQLLSVGIKRNYLINLDYKPNDIVSLKSRVQWSDFEFENQRTTGFALIQDFNFTINKLKIGTRFALFDTDDFENRQFAYEKDVLYSFSIPAYNGVGIRNYLLIQYNLGRKVTVWARIARTSRRDVDTIGSGLGEIDGDHRTDLKVQARYTF